MKLHVDGRAVNACWGKWVHKITLHFVSYSLLLPLTQVKAILFKRCTNTLIKFGLCKSETTTLKKIIHWNLLCSVKRTIFYLPKWFSFSSHNDWSNLHSESGFGSAKRLSQYKIWRVEGRGSNLEYMCLHCDKGTNTQSLPPNTRKREAIHLWVESGPDGFLSSWNSSSYSEKYWPLSQVYCQYIIDN